jgi:hypothetical protein
MLHDRSARIVDFAHLSFVWSNTESFFALSSMQCRPRLASNLRVQAFTAKVGAPLHMSGRRGRKLREKQSL